MKTLAHSGGRGPTSLSLSRLGHCVVLHEHSARTEEGDRMSADDERVDMAGSGERK